MFLLQLSAAWVATDAARARRDRLILAMERTNVSRAAAAFHMRISEQQLSDQLALRQPLNLFRLCDLFQACPDLEDAYAARGLEERGWRVMKDAALLRLVDAVQAMTDRRPMLKSDLPSVTSERRHAS